MNIFSFWSAWYGHLAEPLWVCRESGWSAFLLLARSLFIRLDADQVSWGRLSSCSDHPPAPQLSWLATSETHLAWMFELWVYYLSLWCFSILSSSSRPWYLAQFILFLKPTEVILNLLFSRWELPFSYCFFFVAARSCFVDTLSFQMF